MFFPIHDANPRKFIWFQIVTVGLIAANLLVFLLTNIIPDATNANIIAYTYGIIPVELIGGTQVYELSAPVFEEVTLASYMFLHADIWHLLGNMAFLWVFGDNVEDAMGHVRFLIFFLLCGIVAGLVHSFADTSSDVPLIGASGAIAGVIAAYLMLYPRVRVWVLVLMRIPIRLPAYWILAAWIGFQFFSVWFLSSEDDNVAWWAHIGGFAAGLLLVIPLRKHDVDAHEA